jgi:RNA polymerase sigma-70 factor (ECF subfamily)
MLRHFRLRSTRRGGLLLGKESGMNFWQIYDQYHSPVRKLITALVKDEWVADDLVQETFLRIRENLHTVENPDKIKSWIFRIARNQCLDHFRKTQFISKNVDASRDVSKETPFASFHSQLERDEMSRCVQDKVSRLPEPQRSVLLFFEMLGFNHQEIAETLGMTVSNSKVLLHRARRALKDILETHCTFEHDERDVLVCEPKNEN